jgi:hypothetical protein
MKRLLLLIILIFPSLSEAIETSRGPQKLVENSQNTGAYNKVFEVLKQEHIEFSLFADIPEKNVNLRTRVYFEKNVEYNEYYMEIIEETFQLFFQWSEENNYDLAINRRDHRGMSFYFIDKKSINSRDVVGFTTLSTRINGEIVMAKVHGFYDAWNSSNGDNSLFISHNSGRTKEMIASTISHEMGHFLGDYFRIVDNYYTDATEGVKMEKLAYAFQDYCRVKSKIQ